MRFHRFAVLGFSLCLGFATACSTTIGPSDGATSDTPTATDVSHNEASVADVATQDASAFDAAIADASPPDATPSDVSTVDAVDVPTRDVASADVVGNDVTPPDASPADGGACAYTNCADCNDDANCGWCGATGACMPGTFDGPTNAVCPGNWIPQTSMCPGGGCDRFNDCGTCTTNTGCGFCGASGQCMQGGSAGPSNAVCASGWSWFSTECPTVPCSDHTDCGSCANDSNCGWCAGSGTCMQGTSAGPTNAVCASGWSQNPGDCAGTGCSSHGDCANCVDDFNCGWCGATGACMTGNFDGPTGGTCAAQWDYLMSDCPAAPCNTFTACGACAGANGCGWCGATSTCMSGAEAGPINNVCASGWSFEPAVCPDTGCPSHTDCGSCTRDNNCGWCAGSNTCMAGDLIGPNPGTCAGTWEPTQSDCTAPADAGGPG